MTENQNIDELIVRCEHTLFLLEKNNNGDSRITTRPQFHGSTICELSREQGQIISFDFDFGHLTPLMRRWKVSYPYRSDLSAIHSVYTQ